MEQLATDEHLIAEFRSSITPDLYAASDLVDWSAIDQEVEALSPAIIAVQALAASNDISAAHIASELRREPRALDVLKRLLAVGDRVVFSDGRELPSIVPVDATALAALSELLVELRVASLLPPTADVRQMLVTAMIASEAPRRRFRSRRKLEERIERIIRSATKESHGAGLDVKVVPASLHLATSVALRSVDWVVLIGGTPRAAVTSTFQARSGGRQQRDLVLTYPALQDRLRNDGLDLVLLADGAGIRDTPIRILSDLFGRVFACLTLRQAEEGRLADVFARLAQPRIAGREPLDQVINVALEAGSVVAASGLPATLDHAKLAIATYVQDHPHEALDLKPDASELAWSRLSAVRGCLQLLKEFTSSHAISVLAELLSVRDRREVDGGVVLAFDKDVFMSDRVYVTAADRVDVATIRLTAVRALGQTPNARFALFVVPTITHSEGDAVHRLQYQLAVNVIVLDVATLLTMAKVVDDPVDSLLRLVVAASDLAKVSPFVLTSVAPTRVYYGREIEEATVTTTIQTNSVAILGGRRIGKTSLMKHVTQSITTSGLVPFFGDCQTVRTWLDFVRMAERAWDVHLDSTFTPDHLYQLIEVLSQRSAGHIVLLLDEVDQLLDWDQRASDTSVPEAFFRACRGISQEGKAQFVFSGERVIAAKLWDAQSPHWNFCRPLPLRQLDADAAERLLEEPFRELQVGISDRTDFHNTAWRRTSGHPQLLQFIGDKLVHLLNTRPSDERSLLHAADLIAVTDSYEFVEQYLETYWGQATALERLVSLFVQTDSTVPAALLRSMQAAGISISSDEVLAALRLLDLYGVVELDSHGYRLKAPWFQSALDAYGGVQTLLNELRKEVA